MKHLKKLLLLLVAGMTIQGAWAQTHVLAQAGEQYTITSASGAQTTKTPQYRWYRNNSPIDGDVATHESYTVPAETAFGENVEFKRAVRVDGCDEKKFSNTVTIRFCNVFINGVCWADANVAQPGTFAGKPDNTAEYAYYQWNKPNKAWTLADGGNGAAIAGWSTVATDPTIGAATWSASPCPAGWRLPTREEYVELDGLGGDLTGNKGGKWVAASEKGNAVAGRFYGKNFATCSLPNDMVGCVFFPVMGYRTFTDGALNNQNLRGYGWSSTQASALVSYSLNFSGESSAPDANYTKSSGIPVRCVQ
ncbi:MAG: hypothetical protein LBK47_01105 [Prevotellaceae bacterium]|nr:hypothetical protein [Prevotellaceae bacterium]